MNKCKYCGIRHRNTTEDSKFTEIGDVCMRCELVVNTLNASITAINSFVPLGEERPRRKLTVKGFVIEKI